MKQRRNVRRNQRRKHRAFGMVLMLCLAVGSGYLGVRYVVSPWMEQQGVTETSVKEEVQSQTVIEDKVDTVATTAYAVQLGSFSTEEAAKQRVNELKEQGISAKVQLRDNAWKVVSEGFHTKEEAREAAAQWRNVIGDAFVVAI
ncbi:MAG: SPOR domain-containing protein [Firmicutes bacterium]|nr:SPOR domain-containing protein [Bacillota bacterium]